MKVDKDKRRGIIGTVVVHIIVIFALFLLALRTPLPLPGEEGVEVNLGYTNTGMGQIQKDNPPPVSKPQPVKKVQPTPQPQPEPEQAEEKIIEQDVEDAPAIEDKKEIIEEKKEPEKPEEKPKEKPESIKEPEEKPVEEKVDSTLIADQVQEEVEAEPEPVVNKKALFPGTANNNTQGSNQGVAGGLGDQGRPKGFKDSNRYDGRGGKGNGPSFYLGGRGSLYLDTPNNNFNEQGDVVVDIWVNREGKVVKAQVKTKGTNVLDPNLKQRAVDAAKNSKFEADPKADEVQRGTITYHFVIGG